MKKTVFFLMLLALAVLFAACGETPDTTPDTTPDVTASADTSATDASTGTTAKDTETDSPAIGNAFTEKSGEEMLSLLLADIPSLTLVTESIDPGSESVFRYHFFTYSPDSILSATISQPMIGTIPFFVGILKTSSASEAERLAEEILDNVDYRKLICAEYKRAYTRAVGNTVVLILDGDVTRADEIVARFDSLAAS